MESFVPYFSTGGTYEDKECVKYLASKFLDIQGNIRPFFQKYPCFVYVSLHDTTALLLKQLILWCVMYMRDKLSNFYKFCRVAEIIDKKAHLTPEGI